MQITRSSNDWAKSRQLTVSILITTMIIDDADGIIRCAIPKKSSQQCSSSSRTILIK